MEEMTKNKVEVVDIQFRPGQKVYYFSPNGLEFSVGDHVIMDTARGAEFGICTGANHLVSETEVVLPLRNILRKATAQDEKIVAENREKEEKAFRVCQEKIAEQNLDMQLVGAEASFDGSKILFFFTADERVDFRELVKVLASIFHTRIELRQIGVRDKAKMVGGLGICGRPFCCASFLDDFQPVSIKMAKTQNLSLNPTKISGTCGRLMCCLKYEQDAYEDLLRNAPKAESLVDTPEGRGTVTEVNLLGQKVKVRLEDRPEDILTFRNEEIAVLRSGKAKKTDTPVPEDYAPVSGVVQTKKTQEEKPLFLDSIKLRYTSEVIAEQTQQNPEPEMPKAHRQEHGNRKKRDKQKERTTETAQPKSPENGGEKKANRHRRFHRHHRPKGNKQGE